MPKPKHKDFSHFENEALEETSIETGKLAHGPALTTQALQKREAQITSGKPRVADLQQFLKKLHREQAEDCKQEIRETLEKSLSLQLEKHFQHLMQSSQRDISHMFAPLFKRAEEDVKSLNNAVNTTNALCQRIQQKYTFRWDKPFLVLLITTALTGALVGLSLFLMHTSPLAVFLMDQKAREAYSYGTYWLGLKEKHKAKENEKKRLETRKQTGKSSN